MTEPRRPGARRTRGTVCSATLRGGAADQHVSKTFPGTRALDRRLVRRRRGQIHALVGGNGSGKSTLIKIMAGVYNADPGGTITVGRRRAMPADHTTPALGPGRSGCTSCTRTRRSSPTCRWPRTWPSATASRPPRLGNIRWRALRRRTRPCSSASTSPLRPEARWCARCGPPSGPWWPSPAPCRTRRASTPACSCSTSRPPRCPAPRWSGSWARSTASPRPARPSCSSATASTRSSTRATGPPCCATARLAGTLEGDEITEDRLIELIAGRTLEQAFPSMPAVASPTRSPSRPRTSRAARSRASSFQLRRGEVLGVAGLLGSGRSELLKMIFGAYPIRSGGFELEGRPVQASATSARPWTPASPTCPRTAAPRPRSPT